jgi:cell division protein FtsN
MSVTNRSQSNSLRAQSNNGWRFVRGAFALIALIGISFLFGFFVLARLMPDTHAVSNGVPAVAEGETRQQGAGGREQASAGDSTPQQPNDTTRNTQRPTPNASSGLEPTLEPEDEEPAVQPPTTPDRSTTETMTPSDSASSNRTNGDDGDDEESNSGGVQTPSSPDARRTSRRDRERERERTSERTDPVTPNESPEATSRNSLYRVQVGVYSTKEAAEQEAARIRERGFEANVQTSNAGGRTLYHIQNGIFRNRANAESMQQKLQEAGIQTHLAEISKGTTGKP